MVDTYQDGDRRGDYRSDFTVLNDPKEVSEKLREDSKLKNILLKGFGWKIVNVHLLYCDTIDRKFYSISVEGTNCTAAFLEGLRNRVTIASIDDDVEPREARKITELHDRVLELLEECQTGTEETILPIGICKYDNLREAASSEFRCFAFFTLDRASRESYLNLAERISWHHQYGGLELFVARFRYRDSKRLELECSRMLPAKKLAGPHVEAHADSRRSGRRGIARAESAATVWGIAATLLFAVAFLTVILDPFNEMGPIAELSWLAIIVSFFAMIVALIAAQIASENASFVLKAQRKN